MRNTKKILLSQMREGSLLALWTVSKSGYRISSDLKCSGEPDSGSAPPFVVPNRRRREKVYRSLGDKLLHRNFAALNCDNEKEILKFARKYGLLGHTRMLFHPPQSPVIVGESLSVWRELNTKLGILLSIWDRVDVKDTDWLEQFISWSSPNSVSISFCVKRDGNRHILTSGGWIPTKPGETATIQLLADSDRKVNPHLLSRWCQDDVIEPALFYVCSEVNKKLDSQFSFRIFPPFMNKEIYTMPTTLESAMWLLFAREICGKYDSTICPACGDWFDRHHARERFCSKACKQKAYRIRKGDRK